MDYKNNILKLSEEIVNLDISYGSYTYDADVRDWANRSLRSNLNSLINFFKKLNSLEIIGELNTLLSELDEFNGLEIHKRFSDYLFEEIKLKLNKNEKIEILIPPDLISELKEKIINNLYRIKSHSLPNICRNLGLENGSESEAFSSKTIYISKRLVGKSPNFIFSIAKKILEQEKDDDLEKIVNKILNKENFKDIKNLVFSVVKGHKPDFVIDDVLSGNISFLDKEEYYLVYNYEIKENGLTLENLKNWWSEFKDKEDSLYVRMKKSLSINSPQELFFFEMYYKTFLNEIKSSIKIEVPALLPQVYVMYDLKTQKELLGNKRFEFQIVDFMFILPMNRKIIIEIDGMHHYSEDTDILKPSPVKYSKMVSLDRKLKLSEYEVYRFGAEELNPAKETKEELLINFFTELFRKHKLI